MARDGVGLPAQRRASVYHYPVTDLTDAERAQLGGAGIHNVETPSDFDVHRAIGAVVSGAIPTDTVAKLFREAPVTTKVCLDALKEAINGGAGCSAKTIDLISRAIPVFEAALLAAATDEERGRVREDIMVLVREARQESGENRAFLRTMGSVAAALAMAALGAVVLVATSGRNTEVLRAASKRLNGRI